MNDALQKDLNLLAEMRAQLIEVEAKIVAQCETEQAAFRLCRRHSPVHYSDLALAELMGVSKGHLNQLMNCDQNKRPRWMGRAMQNKLQRICQNRVIDQWAELEDMGMLNCQRTAEQELAAARAHLAALEARHEEL